MAPGIVGLALLCMAFLVWTLVALDTTLGYDEPIYAAMARRAIDGTPANTIGPNRPVGMTPIAMVGMYLGGDEVALRIFPGVLGFLSLLAYAWMICRLFGWIAAALASLVMLSVPVYLRHSVNLLSDIPSVLLGLIAMYVLVSELARRDGPRGRLATAAPLMAAMFYVRYGSVVSLAVLTCVATATFGKRSVARRDIR